MGVISDWYTLNFSKSRMYRIQFVDPVGYDKLARNVRICTGIKIILLLLILAGISVGIYYIWAAHTYVPANDDGKNSTGQEGSPKVKEDSGMSSTSTLVTPTKEALTSTSEPLDGGATISSFTSTPTEPLPGMASGSDDAISKNDEFTTPTISSTEKLVQSYTSPLDEVDRDKKGITSTSTYDALQLSAEIRQMLILIRDNGLIVTDDGNANANCSIIGDGKICIQLYESANSSKSAKKYSENISQGFVVVRINDVWKIYCGKWETFRRLAPIICSNSGLNERPLVLPVPLVELEAEGVNLHTSDHPTENEIPETEGASRDCDGAGYVICQ